MPSSNKKRKKAQGKLDGLGFWKIRLEEKLKGQKLLLDDAIYHGKVPAELVGKLFQYTVCSVEDSICISVKFDDVIITEGRNLWETWTEYDDGDKYMVLNSEQVEKGMQLHKLHLGRVNKRINDEKEVARQRMAEKKEAKEDDFSDIDQFVEEHGLGPKLYKNEFQYLRTDEQRGVHKGKAVTKKKQIWEGAYPASEPQWNHI